MAGIYTRVGEVNPLFSFASGDLVKRCNGVSYYVQGLRHRSVLSYEYAKTAIAAVSHCNEMNTLHEIGSTHNSDEVSRDNSAIFVQI